MGIAPLALYSPEIQVGTMDGLFQCQPLQPFSAALISSVATESDMTPEAAAMKLEDQFRKFPWFVSVGVGRQGDGRAALFLYVKSARHQELKRLESGWMGYDVLIRQSGPMRPLGGAHIVYP
jgi:hypothetical protein